MDKKQIDGLGRQFKGVLKEYIGRFIGDAKLTSDGSADRASGLVQYAAGPENLAGVDVDRLKGVGHQLRGALKEGLATITGDEQLLASGIAARDAGKIQNAAGSARDAARDALVKDQPMMDTNGPTDGSRH